ncbi:hypothetical protein [Bacillus sp. AG4(2022)]|uniref:SGNH/GDSL hydrolase family protein n=1 Tax=Bacillus sp. AG4(2022) TaxID=2962594 RepID=UPI002881A960|nr:hypothetical protein [Bacillus sp. AG4(2022)]MDT0160251.1 hypothetical protein [Bacillus sp. AG4(2022)]
MGIFKYPDPVTGEHKAIDSGAINDGDLRFTPQDIKGIDDKLKTTNELLADTATKEELENAISPKADKAYVDTNLASVNSKVDGIDRGYGGTYATLAALQTAFPTGDSKRYVVSADGKWYYWNGTTWTAGGVFQSTGIAKNTITAGHTTFINTSENLFDLSSNENVNGKYIATDGTVSSLANSKITHKIPVSAGDTIRTVQNETFGPTSKGYFFKGGYYTKSGVYVGEIKATSSSFDINGNVFSFTVPSGLAIDHVKINFDSRSESTFMVVKNVSYPSTYIPFINPKLSPDIKVDYSSLVNIPTTPEQSKTNLEVIAPSKVFVTANDINTSRFVYGKTRQYSTAVYLDHMIKDTTDKDIRFTDFPSEEGDNYPLVSDVSFNGTTWTVNNGKNIDAVAKTLKIISPKHTIADKTVSRVSVKTSLSKAKHPKVLFIGDSQTYGIGADDRYGNGEFAYWGYVKKLFEMDKIDGGDNATEYNFMSLGISRSMTIPIDYKGKVRSVVASADGISGWTLFNHLRHSQYLRASQTTWDALGLGNGSGTDYIGTDAQKDIFASTVENNPIAEPVNPFFDNDKSGNVKFSINKWLQRYRTRDDEGNKLSLGDQRLGTLITTQSQIDNFNVCTPTHVVLAHGRNDVANATINKFIENIQNFIDAVRDEIPNAIIGICTIPDNPGTHFPERYPKILGDTKLPVNRNVFDAVKAQLASFENREAEEVYLIPNYFTQPTAWGLMLQKADMPETLLGVDGWQQEEFRRYRIAGDGVSNHPGSLAHATWGYQVYSWLKYQMSK